MLTNITDYFISSLATLEHIPSLLAKEEIAQTGTDMVKDAANTASTVFTLIMIVIGLLAAAFIGLKIANELGLRGGSTNMDEKEEAALKASKYAKKGEFNLAASYYEKLKDYTNAAQMYEKGGDFTRAGLMYEQLDDPANALEAYKKAKDEIKVAGVLMKTGQYMEAAKIFKAKEQPLKAAKALEALGNNAAAAREYGEAGEYIKASKLYKAAELYKEAGVMYMKSLGGVELSAETLVNYYTYAAFLVMANELDSAAYIYQKILDIDPNFKEAKQRLAQVTNQPEEKAEEPELAPPPPPEPEPPASVMKQTDVDDLFDDLTQAMSSDTKKATLKDIIASGTMEPRNSLRMWMQILKLLYGQHDNGIFYGCIAPEMITIDSENRISMEQPGKRIEPYIAPEVLEGDEPSAPSDIYAMGVIFYEMICGSTDTLGIRFPIDVVPDIPEWLDMMIVKCIANDPSARYPDMNELSSFVLVKGA
ncbi:hypothetical protein ACFLZI_00420, partial [Nitrospirota bacterium]